MIEELPVLYLSDHVTIEHPRRKLLALLQHEWRRYDGVSIAHDDRIELFDILVANMVNARLDTASKIAGIWEDTAHKPVAERWLGLIPQEPRCCPTRFPGTRFHTCSPSSVRSASSRTRSPPRSCTRSTPG